jgi:lysophospholipase L1-like esterase
MRIAIERGSCAASLSDRSRSVTSAIAAATLISLGIGLVVGALRSNPAWFDRHVLENYCPCAPSTLAYETVLRIVLGIFGLVLVAVPPRLVKWMAARRRIGPSRMAVSIGTAVLLALVATDVVLRFTHRPHPLGREPGLPPMRMDAVGNLIPLPSTRKDSAIRTRTVHYEIDADGNRAARFDQTVNPLAPTILFAGESVGIGWGVAYEQTYPALVAAALGVQAVNLAVTGFASDQAYLRTKDMLPKFAHPVALVTLVLPVQLPRNVNARRQRLALQGDALVSMAPSTSLFATSPLLNLLPYHSDEAIRVTRAVLRATVDLARARNADAVFVFTNFGPACLSDEHGTSRLERSLFDGLGAPHVRVNIPPEWTIAYPSEVHPNEKGHEAIAQAVLRLLHDARR